MSGLTFFLLINQYDHKFSRLDIAIDDFKTYFTVNQALFDGETWLYDGETLGRLEPLKSFFTDMKTDSRTLYVGKSDWMIRFYNKKVERENKGYILADDIKKMEPLRNTVTK